MIGASKEAIDMAEDREKFKVAMEELGLDMPRAAIAHSMEEAYQVQAQVGYPTIIRPSFTMGGSGGGIAYNRDEFEEICRRGLDLSPVNELLVEESVLGWKEYEMEVVRDKNDNCIIICSIENLDPMGIHTGDSITVAPAQTLTDKEYQRMRDASLAVLRKIGVETGGSNVQFSVNPEDGRMTIIEMNPRVSRSSALASKATGFPIAKIAAKLAIGYTLDELQNEITGGATPASFEPTIDYVVTKIPRFTFEKFPQAENRLTTQMKSVGEVMAIGRTFQESLQKALRGLEVDIDGLSSVLDPNIAEDEVESFLNQELSLAGADRLLYIGDAYRRGYSNEKMFNLTKIDPWFLVQIEELIKIEQSLAGRALESISKDEMFQLKRKGFSDSLLARAIGTDTKEVREYRHSLAIRPVYKRVDTCAAEFSTSTAYMYSTYEEECEASVDDREKIVVLGGGPNRIGQGIEFDYCCVHAAFAMRDDGYETIMINCNPETVSTDYDTSDRLYFEPLTLEDVLEVMDKEKPKGVIVQYGGQTPLKLARDLEAAGVPVIGTTPDCIDLAEDRERFQQVVNELGLKQPPNRLASSTEEAVKGAAEIGFPLVVRPSYVLGGRAMEIVYNEADLKFYMKNAVSVSNDAPVLLDRFLDDAVEVDVDAICDGEQVLIGSIMEHIEQAGVHSGDSACSLPPYSLTDEVQDQLRVQTRQLALKLGVVGLMNIQFAIQFTEQGENIYLLEVNPRASRTVPFVSKATGVPLAKIAARCMAGVSLKAQGITEEVVPKNYAVKESVFPFVKFPGVDPLLGPEMKSTGEVMGVGDSFGKAYAKAQLGAGVELPTRGRVFISVRERDREHAVLLGRELVAKGFDLVATSGTGAALQAAGIKFRQVNKVYEGRPHIVDMIKNGDIALIINTTEGKKAIKDSYTIRASALQHKVSYTTTIAGANATVLALDYLEVIDVTRLQDLHSVIKQERQEAIV
jgi:carbamoyl-phosphate synthase large subunit